MSKNNIKYTLILFSIGLLFNSCKKEYETIESIDDKKIQEYLSKNNISAIKDESGYYYQVLEQGTGQPMLNRDSIFYNTVVTSLNGTVYYEPVQYYNEGTYLGYVNPEAYRNALYNVNRGGKVRVIVPSYLAFGKNGKDNIPPNEVIISEITVLPEFTQWQIDDRIIKKFITDKGLTADFVKHPSRVYVQTLTQGTGDAVLGGSIITVKYTAKLLTGDLMDESGNEDFNSNLMGLIKGWREVLVGQKVGTKLRLIIPSDLGYGVNGNGPIPGNSVLDFNVEIVKVE